MTALDARWMPDTANRRFECAPGPCASSMACSRPPADIDARVEPMRRAITDSATEPAA
jgi:hypothetical protein